MGQGQPSEIIWTILVVLTYTMLHTKFQGHRSIGSGEEVFTIYGHGSHLGQVTRTVWTTFCSPDPWRLHMKFGYNWPSSFRGEIVWNCWRTTMDDGACLYYKLPRSLRLRWAKNQITNLFLAGLVTHLTLTSIPVLLTTSKGLLTCRHTMLTTPKWLLTGLATPK